MTRACGGCLTRSWLLSRLSGHLDVVRSRIGELLALSDGELLEAVAGAQRSAIEDERARLDIRRLIDTGQAHGVELICRCDPEYPLRLRDLDAPPAVLHVTGGLSRFLALARESPVAIVGSRRASAYGLEMARSLGRSLAACGLPVVSGLARGIDTAAHQGALEAGVTIAVLPGPAHRAYPAAQRGLHRQVTCSGAAVSELPCGSAVRRWSFLARNRIIAALAGMTVIVEATERSGALPTAETARRLGRPIGAVPGQVTTVQATGANALLAGGARVVRGAQDVLDCLYGTGTRLACAEDRFPPAPEHRDVLRALAEGLGVGEALRRAGVGPEQGLAMLAELEMGGWLRHGAGGAYIVIP